MLEVVQDDKISFLLYLECHAKIIFMIDRFIYHLFQEVPYVESS